MPIHDDFKRILANFIKQYGKEKGTEYYYAWLNKHKLDDTKAYSVQAQLGECVGALCESFRWLDEPLIKFYKEDSDGKYYKCVALTANVSMNMNDYSDQIEFQRAAGSLAWRPLNLNHDHGKWLQFPENRVDYAVYEDGRAETVIRIDNSRKDIQRKIEKGEILHPSIEGNPRQVQFTDAGRKIGKWNFTALALLEKDVTLPGDPLTYLEPLPLNESMGRSLVESLSVENREEKDLTENWHEDETLQQEAVWTTSYVNTLPDSSFAYIEPGGKKDGDGKTVPRSLRHLPYKDAEGSVDKAHLVNALARLPQTQIGDSAKATAKGKLCSAVKSWNSSHSDKIMSNVCGEEDLKEYTGINGMDVCGQCRYYEELSNTTKTMPKATGAPDDAEVTTTSGAFAPGVGLCRLATRLEGVNKFVKKNDPVCSDGRVRDTPTDVDRTIERKINLEDIEKEAIKTDYEKRLAEKETTILEETKKTNKEREAKLKALGQVTEQTAQLNDEKKKNTELTGEVARLKEERIKLRDEIDQLREEVSLMNLKVAEKDKDIKYYKDRYDAYERTHQELSNQVITLKEQVARTLEMRDTMSVKVAEKTQQAINAEQDRARIAEENAELLEKITQLQREVMDSNQVRSESAKTYIKDYQKMKELQEKNAEYLENIRELKQKLSKTPTRIKVKG